MRDQLFGMVRGHVKIVDDLGNVLLNKSNAIHPQNMARIFARALANESNSSIYRIAYGNGGTTTDAAYTATFNPPNDGQPPDTRTWDSRLYNETYSEIVDEGNVVLNTLLGTDPGTADPNVGTRPGGGAAPDSDPISSVHTSGPGVRSIEEGIMSQVIITSVLNPDEPSGQISGTDPTFGNTFAFDELGLYTAGAAATASAGIVDVNVGNKTTEDDSGLVRGSTYSFRIRVDDPEGVNPFQVITFTVPGSTGIVTFGELCEAINTGDIDWYPAWNNSNPLPGSANIAITDNTVDYPSITGAQTFGYLRFTSSTVGAGSAVEVDDIGLSNSMFDAFSPGSVLTPVNGANAGEQNDPLSPESERERLLTHLIFTPVLKAASRTLTVTYTLSITFTRTPSS